MATPFPGIGVPILLCLATNFAVAQASTSRPAGVPPAASAAAPKAKSLSILGYESAFERYLPFAEQPLTPWREANDVVRRIGGWQAYAREAQSAASAADAATSASPRAAPPPGTPASQVSPRPVAPAGHSGHIPK